MDSTGASVSLKCLCITAASNQNPDSANTIPHYLRAYTGSCHDICKYGRRRAFEEQPTKPLHKRSSKRSAIVPRLKKEVVNSKPSADSVKPSNDSKSSSPRAKNHSPRQNTSSDAPRVVKRGVALPEMAHVRVKESNCVGSKMSSAYKRTCIQSMKLSAPLRLKPVAVKPSSPSDSSGGVHGKRRRNDEVQSGRNTASSMSSAKKAWIPVGAPLYPNTASGKGRKTARVELLSPRKDEKRAKRVKTDSSSTQLSESILHVSNMGTQNNALESIPGSSSFQEEDDREIKYTVNEVDDQIAVEEDQIKIPRTETESNGFEVEFESVADTPSSSSHGEDDEESDKLVSDTTVSQRKRNHNKRQRKNRAVRSGDKQSRPMKLKFQMGNSINLHKESNVPRGHKFRTREDGMRTDGSVSDSKSVRIGSPKTSRTKDKYHSSKNRRRRVRYGKARILVLEDRKGGLKRNYEENDAAGLELLVRKNNLNHHDLQRKKDVQRLFNYVIEETASKLAERRKGMVKSLVGAFEKLISLQAPHPECFLSIAI